jgi:hypothetical protein
MKKFAEIVNPKFAEVTLRNCASGKVATHSSRPAGAIGRNRSKALPIALQWVTLQTYAVSSGYSVGALRQKIRRGHFAQGLHFRKAPDGRILLNVHACQDWGVAK